MFVDEHGTRGHPSQKYHMSYGGCLSAEVDEKDPDVSSGSDDDSDPGDDTGADEDKTEADERPQFRCIGCDLVWDAESQCGGTSDKCGTTIPC
jgi:hypothetical protein